MAEQEKTKENEKEYEFCLRCGRRLKNPEYRTIGYGPVCLTKIRIMGEDKPVFRLI